MSNDISRRSMLGAAATGAVATLEAANHCQDKAAINVGFISQPSASHRTGYLNVLAKVSGVNKVFVADETGATREDSKRRLGSRFAGFFKSAPQMLGVAQPALAVVTTEGHRAPTAVAASLAADCHVITEKPSCVRLADFERLAKQANEKKREIMLAMATRSSAAVKKTRQLISAGWLGKPYAATMDWIADQTRLKSPSYHKSWLSFKSRAGGGKLIFHGIHYLDLIQYLVGDRIREVSAFCQNVGGQPIEVEDAAVVNYRFGNGMLGTLNTGYYLDRGKQTQIRIWGSLGWLQMDLVARTPVQWYSTHAQAPRGIQNYRYRDAGGLYQIFFQECIDAIREKTSTPITTSESLQALKVVFGGYRSAGSGRHQRV